MLYLFEPVLYLDTVAKLPETTEKPGYFVGFADNVGDALTFKILKNDLSTVLHRSAVRSAADAAHMNKSDIQETLNILDSRPSDQGRLMIAFPTELHLRFEFYRDTYNDV
jgi:hypothetical protein